MLLTTTTEANLRLLKYINKVIINFAKTFSVDCNNNIDFKLFCNRAYQSLIYGDIVYIFKRIFGKHKFSE